MTEDRIKTCFICKLGLNIQEDSFIEIAEFIKGDYYKSIWAHRNCWKEHFSGKTMLKDALAQTKQMMERLRT